jgi:hypothetical protein
MADEVLAAFCAAAIKSALLGAELAGETPVREAFTHDPEETDFSREKLPALFVYRGKHTPEKIEDVQADGVVINVVWAFPQLNQEARKRFRAAADTAYKALLKAFELGRTPGYVHPDEPADGEDGYDRHAATWGSSLLTWGGYHEIEIESGNWTEIAVGAGDSYDGILVVCKATETLDYSAYYDPQPISLVNTITSNEQHEQEQQAP